MLNFLFSIENTLNEKVLGAPRRWVVETTSSWLSLLIIIGVLLLSALLPFKATLQHYTLLIGLLVGIGVALLIMRWPPLGLLGLIGSMVIPFSGPSGLTASMIVVSLLLGLWLLNVMVHRRKMKFVSSSTIRPLLALVFVASLALAVGQLPWYTFAQHAPLGAQFGGWSIFFFSAGAFLLVAHQIRDLRWLQALTWAFLALAAIFVFGRMLGLGRFTNPLFPRGTTDSLFWTWLVALAFSQAVFNRKLHPIWRLALVGLVSGALYISYVQNQDWKSGWVPAVFVVVAVLGARFWRAGFLLAPLGLISASQLVSYGVASDQYSYSTRLEAWTIVWEITKVSPILGLGPANYRWYTPLFPIRGWAVYFNSHSQYVDLIAQTGLLGLVCFLWFFGTVGWLGWRLCQCVPAGFAQAYVYGAFGGLIGTLVAAGLGDWVLPFFYNVGMKGFPSSMLAWLFLGGLVALEIMYREDKPNPKNQNMSPDTDSYAVNLVANP